MYSVGVILHSLLERSDKIWTTVCAFSAHSAERSLPAKWALKFMNPLIEKIWEEKNRLGELHKQVLSERALTSFPSLN